MLKYKFIKTNRSYKAINEDDKDCDAKKENLVN